MRPSPRRACRHTCSSTPSVVTPSKRCGRRRGPEDVGAEQLEQHVVDLASGACGETLLIVPSQGADVDPVDPRSQLHANVRRHNQDAVTGKPLHDQHSLDEFTVGVVQSLVVKWIS